MRSLMCYIEVMKRLMLWLLFCWMPLQAFATANAHLSFHAQPSPTCHVNGGAVLQSAHSELAQHHHTNPQSTTPEALTSEALTHDCCAGEATHNPCDTNGCGLACQIHCVAASSIVSGAQSIPLHAFTPPTLGSVLPYITSINTPPPTKPPRA